MPIPPVADPARLAQLFPNVAPDNPDPQSFELGLVLGGTVSVGAFTAGALDFLLQALEAWQPNAAAQHRVILRTAAGSSGGAVCTAILGLLSGRVVPHITRDFATLVADTADTGNPLWDLWINRLQILPMLSSTDLNSGQDVDAGTNAPPLPHVQHVASILNADVITQAAAGLAAIGETPSQPLPYFAHPFRLAVTVAGLRGIPYDIADVPAVGTFDGAAYMQHDDFACFAVPNGASPTAPLPAGKREDEFWLATGNALEGYTNFQTLADFAVASAAMPLGLAARALSRPAEHYNYRPAVRAVSDLPGYHVDFPLPNWTTMPDVVASGVYHFTAVDGGTLNNDPVSVVHRNLAGLVGKNPRGRSDATRAIFMIDPLAAVTRSVPPTGKSALAVIAGLVPTLVGGARYLTADMMLFADDDVYSRFQLVPFRPAPANTGANANAGAGAGANANANAGAGAGAGASAGTGKLGESALAGDSLFAAAGWCARAFRVHDFLLGRQNMQAYLRGELLLAADNPLFNTWTLGNRQDFARDVDGNGVVIDASTPPATYFLPILPDNTGLGPLPVPPWPAGAYNPGDLHAPLLARIDAVGRKLIADNTGGGPLPWLAGLFAVPTLANFVVDTVVASFTAELTAAGLWPVPGPATAAPSV